MWNQGRSSGHTGGSSGSGGSCASLANVGPKKISFIECLLLARLYICFFGVIHCIFIPDLQISKQGALPHWKSFLGNGSSPGNRAVGHVDLSCSQQIDRTLNNL